MFLIKENDEKTGIWNILSRFIQAVLVKMASIIRFEIWKGLGFTGIAFDEEQNATNGFQILEVRQQVKVIIGNPY